MVSPGGAGALGHQETGPDRTTESSGHRKPARLGRWRRLGIRPRRLDDCSRFAYVEILPDEKRYTATPFWLRALREFRRRGITVQRVLTDNGSAYRSRPFRKACRWLGIAAKRTRPYRPQTNGKAERLIQTLLRKWAYAVPYANSTQRRASLTPWMQFYNAQRPHASLNRQTPLSRLAQFAEQSP